MKKQPLLWCMSIWGQAHWSLFNRFHAPSMLLPGNLDALQELGEPVQCMILTNPADWEIHQPGVELLRRRLGQHNVIGALVPWHQMDGLRPHQIMVELQRLGVENALIRNAALVWTYPDVVMPEGQYASLGKDFEADGVGCIVGRYPSVDGSGASFADGLEGFPELASKYVFARELYKPEMIHPSMRLSMVNQGGVRSNWPACLWWQVENGLICHGFHMDPMICWPTIVDRTKWKQALDIDFTECATFARPVIRVAETFTSAELSIAAKPYDIQCSPMSTEEIHTWALKHATTHGRQAFKSPLLCGEAMLGSAVETRRYARDVLEAKELVA